MTRCDVPLQSTPSATAQKLCARADASRQALFGLGHVSVRTQACLKSMPSCPDGCIDFLHSSVACKHSPAQCITRFGHFPSIERSYYFATPPWYLKKSSVQHQGALKTPLCWTSGSFQKPPIQLSKKLLWSEERQRKWERKRSWYVCAKEKRRGLHASGESSVKGGWKSGVKKRAD